MRPSLKRTKRQTVCSKKKNKLAEIATRKRRAWRKAIPSLGEARSDGKKNGKNLYAPEKSQLGKGPTPKESPNIAIALGEERQTVAQIPDQESCQHRQMAKKVPRTNMSKPSIGGRRDQPIAPVSIGRRDYLFDR